MARILSTPTQAIWSTTPTVARIAPTRDVRVSVLATWRDTIAAFGRGAAPIVVCAALGLAAPLVVGYTIAAQAALANRDWLMPVAANHAPPVLLVQIVAALLLGAFARGTIAAVALGSNAREAVRAGLAHYPAIFVGYAANSILVAACVLAIGHIWRGNNAGVDRALSSWRDLPHALAAGTRQLAARSAYAIPLQGDPALAALTLDVEPLVQQHAMPLSEYERWLNEKAGTTLAPMREAEVSRARAAALAGLLLLALAEPLLRFHTVLAIGPSRSLQASHAPGGEGSRRSLAHCALVVSACFGLRHYGALFAHIWITRLTFVALMLALVEIPQAAVSHVALPWLAAWLGRSPLLPILALIQSCAAALVGALMLAFCTTHDARLFAALEQAAPGETYPARPASAIARSSRSATPISGAHWRM